MNFVRTVEAVWEDLRAAAARARRVDHHQQLARGFFLTPEKTIKRKLTEMLIAEELEQKFTKQQIFEFYANWVDLGQRGSFAIADSPRLEGVFQQRSERHYSARSGVCWPD